MIWKRKKVKVSKDKILEDGYYIIEDNCVRLLKGPFAGVRFIPSEKIKIREDALTRIPNLLYDYTIVDFANHPPEINKSQKLSRIIAAIIVELYDDIQDGRFEQTYV